MTNCATKQIINDWQTYKSQPPGGSTFSSCTARGLLRLETQSESLKGDFKLRFSNSDKNPELLLLFLNPFGQSSGKLELSANQGHWSDETGSITVSKHPLMKRWYSKLWSEELRFIFGLEPNSRVSSIDWSPSTGWKRLSLPNGHIWQCQFQSQTPKECRLKTAELTGELNFTSVECR